MKRVLVAGAGGFVAGHLVTKLKADGCWVRAVDIKKPEFAPTVADEFVVADLRDPAMCDRALDSNFGEVYQLAADMGGMGFIIRPKQISCGITSLSTSAWPTRRHDMECRSISFLRQCAFIGICFQASPS